MHLDWIKMAQGFFHLAAVLSIFELQNGHRKFYIYREKSVFCGAYCY